MNIKFNFDALHFGGLLRRRGVMVGHFLHLFGYRFREVWDEFVRNFARDLPTQF